MQWKQLSTLIILLGALGIGLYVIYEDRAEQKGNNEQLEQYVENEGIDPQVEMESSIKIGEQAINFTLPVYNVEETMSLSELQGDFVIMNMWASWCKPCRDEMPHFIKFHEEYQDENVTMVGVNMTVTERNEETISNFIQDFNIPFPILMDTDGFVYDEYQVFAIPITYIIDPSGKVVNLIRGYINYDILIRLYEEAVEEYEQGL